MRRLLVAGLLALAACRCDEPRSARVLEPFPGRYGGVGLELAIDSGWPKVVRVIPTSAAALAGLRPGDALVEIEGVPTEGWDLATVVAALRGETGTGILVSVRRAGDKKEIVPLRRGRLVRDGGPDGRSYRGER